MSYAAVFTLGYLLGAVVVAALVGLTKAARRRSQHRKRN